MDSDGKLQCYNRGCGLRFKPEKNKEDSCVHHPGAPFFHDAYKGWSCCKKKCTDFTEFLNIKGCTRSMHNSVKPVEPEKPQVDKSKTDEVIVYQAPQPVKQSLLERPPFDSTLVRLKTAISASLQQELDKLKDVSPAENLTVNVPVVGGIAVGTACKHGACKETYKEGLESAVCCFHPGVPIFHEGLKYWSCCTKRTTDFQAFLNQEGCETGIHLWKSSELDASGVKKTQCREDWMQTGTHVVVNIYCKKYNAVEGHLTFVEVNPIRLSVRIDFHGCQEAFTKDVELHGVIDPQNSSVLFTPSKVEIKLKKAEPMSWRRLDVPRAALQQASVQKTQDEKELPKVDALDLSDL